MQVKEAIEKLSKLDKELDICIHWETKPADIHIYTWAWICDNFGAEALRKFDNIFRNAIQSLKELYPYDVRVASGDVIFVERTDIAQE